MIKLIIFDLDGVLADTELIHLHSLRKAVGDILGISRELIEKYIQPDGTTTKHKLSIMSSIFDISPSDLEVVDSYKQALVNMYLTSMTSDSSKLALITELSSQYTLAVGSNSRSSNVNTVLDNLGIRQYFAMILSGDMVTNPKPHPEIFTTIMSKLNIAPQDTLIVEDSDSGATAAILSHAHLLRVNTVDETNLENISHAIKKANNSSTNGRNGV